MDTPEHSGNTTGYTINMDALADRYAHTHSRPELERRLKAYRQIEAGNELEYPNLPQDEIEYMREDLGESIAALQLRLEDPTYETRHARVAAALQGVAEEDGWARIDTAILRGSDSTVTQAADFIAYEISYVIECHAEKHTGNVYDITELRDDIFRTLMEHADIVSDAEPGSAALN